MLDIIRSQIFQYLKKSMIVKIFFVMMVFAMILVCDYIFLSCPILKESPNASGFIVMNFQAILMISIMFVTFNTAYVISSDFNDKTLNYEIMSNHTRLEIFLGRIIWSVITGTAGAYLLMLVPIIIMCIIYGWGDEITVGDMIYRWFLMFFPFARLAAEITLAGFILKKLPLTAFAAYAIYMGSMFFYETYPKAYYTLSISSLNKLAVIDSWITYGLGKDQIYYTYDASVPAETAVIIICASAVAVLIFGFVGYSFFRTDDID